MQAFKQTKDALRLLLFEADAVVTDGDHALTIL
jgi:hypothetical protein